MNALSQLVVGVLFVHMSYRFISVTVSATVHDSSKIIKTLKSSMSSDSSSSAKSMRSLRRLAKWIFVSSLGMMFYVLLVPIVALSGKRFSGMYGVNATNYGIVRLA